VAEPSEPNAQAQGGSGTVTPTEASDLVGRNKEICPGSVQEVESEPDGLRHVARVE
jgi:hypothetical protein